MSDIYQQYRNPPRALTPPQDDDVEEEEEEEEEEEKLPIIVESTADTDITVSAEGESTITLTNSLRFIQESEIETPAFDGVWVEKADATGHQEEVNGDASEAPVTPSVPVAEVRINS